MSNPDINNPLYAEADRISQNFDQPALGEGGETNSLTEWWHASGHPTDLTPLGAQPGNSGGLNAMQEMNAGLLRANRNIELQQSMQQSMQGMNLYEQRLLRDQDVKVHNHFINYAKTHLKDAPNEIKRDYVEREMARYERRAPRLGHDQLAAVQAWDVFNHNDSLSATGRTLIEAKALLLERRNPEAQKLLLQADKKTPIDSLKWGESLVDAKGKINAHAVELKIDTLRTFLVTRPGESERDVKLANHNFLALMERKVSGRTLTAEEQKHLAEDEAFRMVVYDCVTQPKLHAHLPEERIAGNTNITKSEALERQVVQIATHFRNSAQPDMDHIAQLLGGRAALHSVGVKADQSVNGARAFKGFAGAVGDTSAVKPALDSTKFGPAANIVQVQETDANGLPKVFIVNNPTTGKNYRIVLDDPSQLQNPANAATPITYARSDINGLPLEPASHVRSKGANSASATDSSTTDNIDYLNTGGTGASSYDPMTGYDGNGSFDPNAANYNDYGNNGYGNGYGNGNGRGGYPYGGGGYPYGGGGYP